MTKRCQLLLVGLAAAALLGTVEQVRGRCAAGARAFPEKRSRHVSTTAEDAATRAAATALALHARRAIAPLPVGIRGEHDPQALEADLVRLGTHPPRGHDLTALRVDLEQLLRDRPELAPAVARAFDRIDDRLVLFALSRALVPGLAQPSVRATLEADASSSPAEARREIALRALSGTGDARLVELERATLDDTTAPASVRAAAADGLARDWAALDAPAAERARDVARGLASARSQDAAVRESALHLLATAGPGPDDALLARQVLAEPTASPRVALAAARVGLTAGQDRSDVARALASHSTNPDDLCGRAAARLSRTDLGGEP